MQTHIKFTCPYPPIGTPHRQTMSMGGSSLGTVICTTSENYRYRYRIKNKARLNLMTLIEIKSISSFVVPCLAFLVTQTEIAN